MPKRSWAGVLTSLNSLKLARQQTADDVDLQDETVRRVKGRFLEQTANFKQEFSAVGQELARFQRENPGEEFPVTLLSKLFPSQRAALNKSFNAKRTTNFKKWFKFQNLSNIELREMSPEEFEANYLYDMSVSDGKKARGIFLDARKGGALAKSNSNVNDLIKEGMLGAKLVSKLEGFTSNKGGLLFLRFKNHVDELLDDFEVANKRKPSGDELRSLVQKSIDRKVLIDDFGADSEVHPLQVEPGDQEDVYDPNLEVPSAFRKRFREVAIANGQDPDEDLLVEKVYYQFVQSRRKK